MHSFWRCFGFWILLLWLVSGSHQEKRCPPQEIILPCRCLLKKQQFQIWCSHSDLSSVLEGLRAVAQFIPETVDELILENNYLPSLPGRAFLPLKAMRLMLRYNGLERVSSDWLIGLEKSLVELFIVEPDLRSLPDDSLVHMHVLEAITVQTNLMKRFPIFSNLSKLRYLQLESLSLIELSPRNFNGLEFLETVHISNSPRLKKLEGGLFEDLPRLRLLNISYCGIDWVHPRAVTRLPALKVFSLVGNKIVDVAMVGRVARNLQSLEVLMLDHNYIDKVSEAAFVDLPMLKKLHLSNNHIVELEYGSFHRVPQLRSLDLTKNGVRRVHPESFLQHSGSGLQELWLINNDISHVSELRSLLDALPRLTFLDMSYNNLEIIPFGALRGHPTLERLHLNFNKIHLIEREAFMAMPALHELRLSNNSLNELLDSPLWNLPSLKGLDLSGNYYRALEPRTLANLPALRRVDFSLNDISIVDRTAFLATPSLEFVNLSHNALTTLHPGTFRHLLGLYELDISYNNLVEFVPNLPRGVEYVHVSHNRIEAFPVVPDFDLPSLRTLDMAHNRVRSVPKESLRSLPQLRRLLLGGNAMQKLEEGSLVGISRLEVLDLQSNHLAAIHPLCFRQLNELRSLNLRDNRLDILFPEIFTNLTQLRQLDLSRNQIAEVLPNTLVANNKLQEIDASYNFLVSIPRSFSQLTQLRTVDLTNNRLKSIDQDSLQGLTSLKDLKLSRNFLHELKRNSFRSLYKLRNLHLDHNELEAIESKSIHSLQSLRSLKLNGNKLSSLPNYTFDDLPSLQMAHLEENQLRSVADLAFNDVPRLIMLNLSHNALGSLEFAGLATLKSLEMLDVSYNKISSVGNAHLEKMEWLVELRMDNNGICAIHGAPFNGMPRLRVLSLKNNRMVSLPEKAMQKLRSNIAVLDIDGNPLSCSCGLLWLQAWLQEGSSMGPRCADGTLLREMRLSRQDCSSAEARNVDSNPPVCETELLSGPGSFGTSQVSSPWTRNITVNQPIPSPEESEYFYDDYVDYPYNESLQLNNQQTGVLSSTRSPHVVPGDTPTIYAAPKNKTKDIPKEVSNSPSTSGFTFFGVPLPSLSFNNLLGGVSGNSGRKEDKPPLKIAERKVAIMNRPSHHHVGEISGRLTLPDLPEIEEGGFVPLLPGSGGFKPIQNPLLTTSSSIQPQLKPQAQPTFHPRPHASITGVRKFQDSSSSSSSGSVSTERSFQLKDDLEKRKDLPPFPSPSSSTSLPILTQKPSTKPPSIFPDLPVLPSPDFSSVADVDEIITESPLDQPIGQVLPKPEVSEPHIPVFTTGSQKPELEIGSNPLPFEIPVTETANTTSSLAPQDTPTPPTTEEILSSASSQRVEESKKAPATPLSALLVPGGQQPQFRPQPGRSSVVKVVSPHVSGSAPLLSSLEPPMTLAQSREGKTRKNLMPTEEPQERSTEDVSWYFANYNKTSLEPFVGTGSMVSVGSRLYQRYVLSLTPVLLYIVV